MGNSIAANVIRLFDRRYLEIDSISGKIDRDQIRGRHQMHEICVENVEMFGYRHIQNQSIQVYRWA